MALIQGTQVEARFLRFKGQHPDLYYAAQETGDNLASINAGNSSATCLCVGLSGVNGAFLSALSPTQKRANLTPLTGTPPRHNCQGSNYDDYQDRHLKLLATADAGGTQWESYAQTDPCQFSYVNATRVHQAQGYVEGVCFVDVFDPGLAPDGNSSNVAMIYVAPPFGGNYSTEAAFLTAIEQTAATIVETVSAYNAMATSKSLPMIGVLRNTLYSSGFYNQNPAVSQDAIARAIFKGFADALGKDANTGLTEIQFPVGDAALNQDHPLFAAVEQDMASAPAPVQAMAHPAAQVRVMPVVQPLPVEVIPPEETPETDPLAATRPPDVNVAAHAPDPGPLLTGTQTLTAAEATLRRSTNALDSLLRAHKQIPPQVNAGQVTAANGNIYDSISAALEYQSPVQYGTLPSDATRFGLGSASDLADVGKIQGQILQARNLTEARAVVDWAGRKAARARIWVERAETANQANPGSNEQTAFITSARVAADNAVGLVNEMEALVRNQEKLAESSFRDANGRVVMRRVVCAAVGIGLPVLSLLSTTIGLLVHFFANGGAAQAATPPKNQALDVEGLDTAASVPVDVLQQNVALDPGFPADQVKAVHLTDASGNRNDNPGTGWTVNGTTITYMPPVGATPKSGTAVSTFYDFEYTDSTIAASAATKLTLTFVDPAVDIAVPAKLVNGSNGSIQAAFTIPDASQFVFKPVANADAWMLDSTSGTEIFTVPAGLTAAAVSENYQLGTSLTTNTARLIVLLPPAPIVLSKSASTTMQTFAALPSPGVAGVTWTLVDASNNPLSSPSDGWSIDNAGSSGATSDRIVFTPGATPPAADSTSTISFGLVVSIGTGANAKPVVSQSAQASIVFAGGTGPVLNPATALVFVAPDRIGIKGSFSFPIPSGTSGLAVGSASVTTSAQTAGGGWSVANNTLIFTPASSTTLTVAPELDNATNTYTATSLSGSASLTILFPLDIVVNQADRQAPTSIDVANANARFIKMKMIKSLAVKDTSPSMDSSGGTWTDLGASKLTPMSGVLQFAPPANPNPEITSGSVLQIPQVVKEYVITFTDGTTTTANVTINFETSLRAYDVNYEAAATETSITFVIADYCYFSAASAYRRLANKVVITGPDGWDESSTIPQVSVTLNIPSGSTASSFSASFDIEDQTMTLSPWTITVTRAKAMQLMPKTANFLLTKDVWTATSTEHAAGLDVLSNCRAFYGIDPSTVVLTGPLDLGSDYNIPDAMLTTDRKALRVPGEGSWLVATDGTVGFIAETGITMPPTPVGFRYQDKKGNWSSEGLMIIHPDLDMILGIPKTAQALSDDDFWKNIQSNVIWYLPRVSNDDFAANLTLLANITHAAGMVGSNPISPADFKQAFATWFAAGKIWHEPSGKEDPSALFYICRDLVDKATKGTQLPMRTRYWRLALMAQMMSHKPMLDLIEQ